MMKVACIFSILLVSALAEETSVVEEFSSGNKQFTAAVYNELLTDNSNLVVSPFSLETVLALTQSGALDSTGEEIRTTLNLPDTKEETEKVVKSILPTLKNEKYSLKTANRVYVKEGYSIKEDFKKTASDVYQAGFETVNFAQNIEAAEKINKWVEEETDNKIQDLISSSDINEDTKLILVNALYFQGTWLNPFDTDFTQKQSFSISEDKSVDTEMMYQMKIHHSYFESEELDAKFLELPFEGDDATMTFILPNKKDGLATLEKQKDRLFVNPEYKNESVVVALPKFKIETSIDFTEVLQKMGVRKAFTPLEADFSGIAGEKGDLFIGKVNQKTFIDVSESGVAAAGATAVEMPTLSADAKEFIADHPFIFYIKVKDVVLFEGRVLQP